MEEPNLSLKQEKLAAITKFKRAQAIRKAIKLSLISIPVLSFLFPNSSCIQYLVNSNTFQLSSSLVNSLRDINREVMFLICNAIVLFLIKDSGLIGIVQLPDEHRRESLVRESHSGSPGEDSKSITTFTAATTTKQVVWGDGGEDMEGEECVDCLDIIVVKDDLDEDYEVDGSVEVEELNKIFDEFIERFKRERRLEALQLIVV